MNYLFKIVFILIILPTSMYGQISKFTIDGKSITLLDSTYSFQDSTQADFVKNNTKSIWNLRQQITKLGFDHCNHNEVAMLLYADTSGAIPLLQIVTGTNLLKIDSQIILTTREYSKIFKPVKTNLSLIYIKYHFHDKEMEALLSKSEGNYSLSSIFTSPDFKKIFNNGEKIRATECENDSYFFKEGMNYFQEGNYKMAIYNLTQSLIANPCNMDANYKLGLAYQKSEKLKKACECFSKGDLLGDTSSMEAKKKYCMELK